MDVRAGSTEQNKGTVPPQLSCELCRERKVKCDKGEPCGNCVAAGVICKPVHRLRLPRGRHARRAQLRASPSPSRAVLQAHGANRDLTKRIHRLEVLVESMGSVMQSPGTASQVSTERTAEAAVEPGVAVIAKGTRRHGPLIGGADVFWADLVEEIHGLRGVIETAPGEADEEIAQEPDPEQGGLGDGGMRMLGFSPSNSLSSSWQWNPTGLPLSSGQPAARQLCEVYLRQVDPIIKILHRPTLEGWLLQGQGYLGYPDGHPSIVALCSAVCYSAANSMTENQCQAMFQTSKPEVVADCRRSCEGALEKSGLLATRDITVLQAFVLYLIARRSGERTRAVWTLVAVAVRIAKGLSLHLDAHKEARCSETFFEQQMRLRLWLTISLIDVQASLNQASEPLIHPSEVESSVDLVKNVNDSDFDLTTEGPVSDREGLTDTTFALVTYHVQLFGRQLNFATPRERNDGSERSMPSASLGFLVDVETAQQHAQRFQERALKLLHFCDPESSPFAWFTWHGTQCLVASARLSSLRPLRRARGDKELRPPHTRDETELLRYTLMALEKMELMHTDPRGEGFQWYITIQWHALAVGIAECYVCTDVPLVRKAWPVIEALYSRHEAIIMQHSGGKLQGPLGKLMSRTREKLKPILNEDETTISDKSVPVASPAVSVPTTIPTQTPVESMWADTILTSLAKVSHDVTASPAPLLTQQHAWRSTSSPFISQPDLAASVSTMGIDPQQGTWDQSWSAWDDFVSDLSFDNPAGPASFFYDHDLEGRQ